MSKIEDAIAKLNKDHGVGTVIRMGDEPDQSIEAIPSGNILLDEILGIGGLPVGRTVEFYGKEGSGKSTLAMQVIAEAQHLGKICCVVDAEHSFDAAYAGRLGIDVDNLLVSQPSYGEQALEVVEALVSSGEAGVIVVDSVAALTPRAEIEGDMGDSVPGDTPILVRRDGMVDIVPIKDLYHGSKTFPSNRHTFRYSKFKGKGRTSPEVLTHLGWKPITAVIFKENRNSKPVFVTKANNNVTKTTADHSLFVDGEEKSPSELSIGDTVDTFLPEKTNDRELISAGTAWLLGYWTAEGSMHGRGVTVCDTSLDNINKWSKLAERHLGVDVSIKKRTYTSPNPRVPLYLASASYRSDVYSLFSSALTIDGEKKVPDIILNGTSELKEAFLEGFKLGDGTVNLERYELSTSSFVLAAGLRYLLYCLDLPGWISAVHRGGNRKTEFSVNTSLYPERQRYDDNEIKNIFEAETPEYLYDIETEAGTFVGGVGFIVHHNSHVGLHARLMSQALRKLTALVHENNTLLIFINQLRENIGMMGFGPKTTTPGGRALKFYSSVRLELTPIGKIEVKGERIGDNVKVKTAKNRFAAPFQTVELELMYGRGFSNEGAILDFCLDNGVLKQNGAWFSDVDGTKLGQGREAARTYLEENPDYAAACLERVYN